jgi:hypothetical protein
MVTTGVEALDHTWMTLLQAEEGAGSLKRRRTAEGIATPDGALRRVIMTLRNASGDGRKRTPTAFQGVPKM